MRHRITLILIILGFALSSCNEATRQVSSTVTSPGVLTPFVTVTPSPTRQRPTIQVTIQITPTPSPTPVMYTVKNDDTMLGIAFKFGISLQELQAANPTIDPHFMGEGLQLVIPNPEITPEALPSPTAIPVQLTKPSCIRTGDGGAWCIVAIQNVLDTSLENLSVWIGLFDKSNEMIKGQSTYAPLNILRPGESMPFLAYFPAPLPDEFEARSEVISALTVNAADVRYLDSQVQVEQVEIGSGGMEAALSGEVVLPEGTTLSQLWLLAVAYDADGNIVGVRKWKSAGETEFSFSVFSLGGAIDHVEILSEARP
jgi:hypothetical protein